MFRWSSSLLTMALAVLLTGCSSSAPPSKPASEPSTSDQRDAPSAAAAPVAPVATTAPAPASALTIKVGTLSTVADGPQYLAAERGYFREEGLDVVFENFGST